MTKMCSPTAWHSMKVTQGYYTSHMPLHTSRTSNTSTVLRMLTNILLCEYIFFLGLLLSFVTHMKVIIHREKYILSKLGVIMRIV